MFRKILVEIVIISFALTAVPSIASAAQTAPTNLQGRADANGARLTWNAASGAGGYNVYRNNQYQTTVTNSPYTDRIVNSTYSIEGTYRYYIVAFDQSKQQFSVPSNEISVLIDDTTITPVDDPTPNPSIAAPRSLRLLETSSDEEVQLFWQPVVGAEGYNVYRNDRYLDTVITDKEAYKIYSDKNPLEGVNEYYVTAFDASRELFSAPSNRITYLNIINSKANTPEPVIDPPLNDQNLVDLDSLSIPGVNRSGYHLVFSDEFNGARLNPQRWNTQLRWDGEYNGERYEYRLINGEQQFYVNIYSNDQEHLDTVVPEYNPFEFDGNRLAIRAVQNPLKSSNSDKSYGPLRDIVSQQHFLSGVISTFDKFSQKYGYYEARIKIPKHNGTFPAFWLHHQKKNDEGTRKTEIDIMENLGHFPWYIYNSFHYTGGSPKPQPQGQIGSETGVHYSEDYHVYAVEWEPGRITWFIDGVQVSELVNSNVDYEELYLIINLAMGGSWIDSANNSGGFGRHYPIKHLDLGLENFHNPALEIDYVRVYKRR
jgi:beta-glucanase (GH16 family)